MAGLGASQKSPGSYQGIASAMPKVHSFKTTRSGAALRLHSNTIKNKKDIAQAMSLAYQQLELYLFSFKPAPNSLRCAIGRTARAATAGAPAAAP